MLPKSALSFTTILLLSVTSLHAMKFETLGYKSISMGGAAVANSSGSTATYNNPALLAKAPYSVEVSVGVGVSTYDHGALASIKKLEDLGFMETMDDIPDNLEDLVATDTGTLIEGTQVIVDMDGNAVTISPQAYVGAQVSGFGFGVFGSTNATAITDVNQSATRLIFADTSSGTGYSEILDTGIDQNISAADYNSYSIESAINSGSTALDVRGVALVEVPIAYGHSFKTSLGYIMVGGALKYMQAITYTERMKLDDSGEVEGDVRKDKTSSNFGVDIGLAYQPSFSYDLTFGLVAKNLNSPEFDFADGKTYKIEPLVRVGVAYDIFEALQVAADYDVTSNKTLNPAVESQTVGGGISYEPFTDFFALSLRAGLMQNLHEADKSGLIYAAGLGIGFKRIQIDLSGEMSSNTNTLDDISVPQYTKVSLALISRW